MEPLSGRSSPTIHSPIQAVLPLIPSTTFNLQESITSFLMDEDCAKDVSEKAQDSSPEAASFFDLQPPPSTAHHTNIENLMQRLLSEEHLHFILGDHALFARFSSFLNHYRPNLVPTLIRYLEMRKAMKAIEYANAVVKKIRWPSHTDYCKFSKLKAASQDLRFEDYALRELALLCSEALPAFITAALIGAVSDCVAKDITGQGLPFMKDVVGNLAEVFCLTDPSRHDNPIIYASEGQYFLEPTCIYESSMPVLKRRIYRVP